MDLDVGQVLPGKVTGITKFGAFVTIAPGKSGLVHISEIASTYVNDVREHLTVGQEVTVKIIGVDQTGRVNLSIKAAIPAAPPPVRQQMPRQSSPRQSFSGASSGNVYAPEPTFEDKLKRFMQDSDNKMSGIKQFSDKRSPRRRGGK